MTKLFFLFCGFIPLLCYSQSSKVISLKYPVSDFIFEEKENGISISSRYSVSSYEADTLAPALPYVATYVLLDTDKDYDGFSFSFSENSVREGVSINGRKRPVTTSKRDKKNFYDVNLVKDSYPEELVKETGVYELGGYKCVCFLVSPFRYDVQTKNLYLMSSIELTIFQKDAPRKEYRDENSFLNPVVQSLVVNKQDVIGDRFSGNLYSRTNYKYLIITHDSLKNAFQRLADWKTTKGLSAKILTTEEIYENYYGGSDYPEINSIRSAISDYYNRRHNLEYVLLGGDIDIVPSFMMGIRYDDENCSSTTPADWYYGNMANSGYTFPNDIIVSRLPVSTYADAETMVDRIIEYESNPKLNNWHNKILVSGCEIDHFINNISDVQVYGDTLVYDIISPLWNGGNREVLRFYDTDTDFSGGEQYECSATNFQTELSKGYTLVNFDTHGTDSCYDMEILPYYDLAYARNLVNCGYTVITTAACHTNSFDVVEGSGTECLSEAFMRNPNGGILTYIGSSREGWIPQSFECNRAIYYSLLSSNHNQIGRAFRDAKNTWVAHSQIYGSPHRWLLFSTNMLGDPEMPLYLSDPMVFKGISATLNGNNLTIQCSTYNNCKISVMNKNDMGDSYYRVRDSVNVATFYNIPEECLVCITKTGYIPYVFTFCKTKYIQNESLEGNQNIHAEEVFIGRNVTALKPEGPVSIENGKTTIKASQGVTIKNDFEVKSGAEFEIKIN